MLPRCQLISISINNQENDLIVGSDTPTEHRARLGSLTKLSASGYQKPRARASPDPALFLGEVVADVAAVIAHGAFGLLLLFLNLESCNMASVGSCLSRVFRRARPRATADILRAERFIERTSLRILTKKAGKRLGLNRRSGAILQGRNSGFARAIARLRPRSFPCVCCSPRPDRGRSCRG